MHMLHAFYPQLQEKSSNFDHDLLVSHKKADFAITIIYHSITPPFNMKTSLATVLGACAAIAALAPGSSAFSQTSIQTPKPSFTTRRNMFGGAGAAAPLEEDDPEKEKQMEAMAKAMNMPLSEYKLAMNARARFEEACNKARVSAGEKGVTVERDGNAATKFLEVTITEDGKKLGKADLEKELVAAFKSSREQSKATRDGEQQKMLQFIAEESKKL
uniref:Uncharacterized protein n=1 Tax=Ditylum brightwellii TaxID=49249 RepID=A0A7S1YP97_9STRA|mmetsp:Transcript_11061/g.16479  ORF Transcript_11061/g.16479 Transcript_11061/m.16479 type:complete len:216 (+) Transcript_11061:42-689(+)